MNLKWDSQKATLLLSIPRPGVDSRIVSYAQQNGYVEKSEIHITLVSFQNGKKILQSGEGIAEKALDLAQSYRWEFELVQEYFVLERFIKEFILNGVVQTPAHTRRSIIQMVRVPDMTDFFIKLSELTKTFFETPISHLTLFSWSDYEREMFSGIGVNSEEDFKKYLKEKL